MEKNCYKGYIIVLNILRKYIKLRFNFQYCKYW